MFIQVKDIYDSNFMININHIILMQDGGQEGTIFTLIGDKEVISKSAYVDSKQDVELAEARMHS